MATAGTECRRACPGNRQPHRIDADHFSSSRIQLAHSVAALLGQVTVPFGYAIL